VAAAGKVDAATQLHRVLSKKFPGDDLFPVNSQSLRSNNGSIRQGFGGLREELHPLWQPELGKAYFLPARQNPGAAEILA